jgi:hypothetical protein
VEGELAILAATGHWARFRQGKPRDTLYSHYDVAVCACCGEASCRFRACARSAPGSYPAVPDLDVTLVTLEDIQRQHTAWLARVRKH